MGEQLAEKQGKNARNAPKWNTAFQDNTRVAQKNEFYKESGVRAKKKVDLYGLEARKLGGAVKELEGTILANANRNQCLMFGEDHYEQGDEAFFMKLMPRLRKMGYRTLAIEMGTGQQELIDKYLKGKISERELAERFRRDFGMLSEQHTDVLHEAKKLGMRAVAYHRSEGASESEIGKVQFGAIKENILDKRRGEKFLVFCGSTHMNRSQEKKDLGYYLDRNVKGNFTILQNFGQAEFAEVHAGYDVDLLINWAQMKQESA